MADKKCAYENVGIFQMSLVIIAISGHNEQHQDHGRCSLMIIKKDG